MVGPGLRALACAVGFGDLYFSVLWSKPNLLWLLEQPLFSLNVENLNDASSLFQVGVTLWVSTMEVLV